MDDAVCASFKNCAPATDPVSHSGFGADRTLVVSTPYQPIDIPRELGHEAYSYHFVYKALAPLLARWAKVQEIDRPESRLDFKCSMECQKQGRQPSSQLVALAHDVSTRTPRRRRFLLGNSPISLISI